MRCCAAALLAAQAARAASSAYFHPAGAPSPRPREETIPVVDIGPYVRWREAVGRYWPHDGKPPLPEACEKIVKQWGDAFRACGFCQVLGHGVPDDVDKTDQTLEAVRVDLNHRMNELQEEMNKNMAEIKALLGASNDGE